MSFVDLSKLYTYTLKNSPKSVNAARSCEQLKLVNITRFGSSRPKTVIFTTFPTHVCIRDNNLNA